MRGAINDTNSKFELAHRLSEITTIDEALLQGRRHLSSYSVAQRMSWASQRITTRAEDGAYCLLGLFGINMPLIYGEENMAFRRLQEEIIRTTDDLSIFAWRLSTDTKGYSKASFQLYDDDEGEDNGDEATFVSGVLAESPCAFASCAAFERTTTEDLLEFSSTNVGLRTRMRMKKIQCSPNSFALVLPLNCERESHTVGLRLRQVGPRQYVRTDPWSLCIVTSLHESLPVEERILLTALPKGQPYSHFLYAPLRWIMPNIRLNVVRIKAGPTITLREIWPPDRFDHEDGLYSVAVESERDFGIIDFSYRMVHKCDQYSIDQELVYSIIIVRQSLLKRRDSSYQYGIVDHKQSSDELVRLRTIMERSGGDKKAFMEVLKVLKVPRVLSVYQETQRSQGPVALLSVESLLSHDKSTARGIRQDLIIKDRIFQRGEAPPIDQRYDWSLDTVDVGREGLYIKF
jgi:hypothetical protein